MRAAVYYSNSDIRVEERPDPTARAGEVVFRIEASGICGSDVMEWYRLPKAPLVLGHEVAGTVTDVGAGVTRFRPGDRIVATHHVPCNTCRYCLTGRESVCDTLRTSTFDPGGFAERVRLPAINVDRGTFRIPDSVTFEEASFVEPLACVVRGQRLAGIGPGTSVAVLGSGISGVLHLAAAKALGAGPLVATDVWDWRLDAARRYGADHAVLATDDVPGEVREVCSGRGADVVVVCTAALGAVEQALRSVDRGGTVLFFAVVDPGTTWPMPLHDIWKDGITIVHSYAGPPADMRIALDLIASRRVEVASMVTHRLSLGETAEGFRLVTEARDSLKVIVEPCR